MPANIYTSSIPNMISTLEKLQRVLENNPDQRMVGPNRVISRTAKTVVPGMSVDFPNVGWKECVGFSHTGDQVLISDGAQCFWTVGENERVRTRRQI